MKIHVIGNGGLDKELRRQLAQYATLAYLAGSVCRICGKAFSPDDVETATHAGVSSCGTAQAAHAICWQGRHNTKWAYE